MKNTSCAVFLLMMTVIDILTSAEEKAIISSKRWIFGNPLIACLWTPFMLAPHLLLRYPQHRICRITWHVSAAGQASEGAANPYGQTHEEEGRRWMEVRMEEEGVWWGRASRAGGSQRAEPREQWGMTTCARGPALRNWPQTLSRAGTGPETDRQTDRGEWRK